MANIERYSITKLNNENYFNWKFRVEMLLKEKDVWSAISKETPSTITDAWTKADEKALATIVLTIEDSQLQHVRSCATAKAAWNALKEFHQKDSAGSRVRILRNIMRQRAEESTNIEEHVNKITELFQKLNSLDQEIKLEFLMSATLLGTLPSSYDSLITALEARKEEELTSSFVRSKIIEEYQRRIERDTNRNESAALKVSSFKQNTNSNVKSCSFCKKRGHEKKNCRKLARVNKEKSGNTSNNANMVGQCSMTQNEIIFAVGKINGWIIDSGATCHISCDKSLFVELDMNHHETVSVADGNKAQSSGRGTIKVQFTSEAGISTNVTISDVLYVPKIGGNLISVKRLTQNGFNVNFSDTRCEIRTADGNQIAVGDIQDGLYKLRENNKNNTVNFVKNNAKLCAHDWHRILGHRDMNIVKRLPSSDLIDGFKMQKCSEKCKSLTDCDICVKGKMSRLPFPKTSNRETEVLELIHSDLCGPMQTTTPRNAYMV